LGTVSSDPEKNWVSAVRAEKDSSRFRVQVVEGPMFIFYIHQFDGFTVDLPWGSEILSDPIRDDFECMLNGV
jgi:hypothetical protein